MNLLELKVQDKATGKIYGFSSNPTENTIIEIHYCTSYFQFVIQEYNEGRYIIKNLICPFDNANPIDLMCIGEGELGEIVQGV